VELILEWKRMDWKKKREESKVLWIKGKIVKNEKK